MSDVMDVQSDEEIALACNFQICEGGRRVARAKLYVIHNELHEEPYGLLEDVFVEESHRGQGYGGGIVQAVIQKAKELGCYKLIATSRFKRGKVHVLYEQMDFLKWGYEFRMHLDD